MHFHSLTAVAWQRLLMKRGGMPVLPLPAQSSRASTAGKHVEGKVAAYDKTADR